MKAINGYQNILRAIGQGLENLEVSSFELEVAENHYIVSGRCRKSHSTLTPIPKKSFLGLIHDIALRKTSPSFESANFYFSQLWFSRSDIELLDRKGRVLRSELYRSPANRHSTSNVLRMVGGYLDHTNGRLLKLSCQRHILTVWYLNPVGVEVREIFTQPILHELQRTMASNLNRLAS